MTVLASACALVDDLVDSGSFYRGQVSACDYGILNTAGSRAVVLRPGGYSGEDVSFGGVSEDSWAMRVEAFVKDSGDPAKDQAHVYDLMDALVGAVRAGSNANTADGARTAKVATLDHNPGVMADFGGIEYLLVVGMIEVKEDT